ncbi:hypothetical protein B0H13DRAFT_1866337 [Mycena leptocephala]|nr:hypothetical protein B0H13DRAFT_1866337 [Mycena leptocephala]
MLYNDSLASILVLVWQLLSPSMSNNASEVLNRFLKRDYRGKVLGPDTAGKCHGRGFMGVAGGAESTDTSGSAAGPINTNTNDTIPAEKTPAKKRARNMHGIRLKEVPKNAKSTQRALQPVIRAMSGLLTQADVLPSAIEAWKHSDKCFDDVDDYRAHMRTLVDESRTAVQAGSDLATRLIRDAKRISGPIANDIARIPEAHIATVFTMVLKAGLKGFRPDLEGPAYSACNQLHRRLAVSAFQFLSASFALSALDINNKVTEDTILMCDIRPGWRGGTPAVSAEYKARTRVAKVRFETAVRLELRKPVKRMAYIEEVHSDDEHSAGERYATSVRSQGAILLLPGSFARNSILKRRRIASATRSGVRIQHPNSGGAGRDPGSDVDDEEDMEINLEDTDDEEDEAREEMEVDEEVEI